MSLVWVKLTSSSNTTYDGNWFEFTLPITDVEETVSKRVMLDRVSMFGSVALEDGNGLVNRIVIEFGKETLRLTGKIVVDGNVARIAFNERLYYKFKRHWGCEELKIRIKLECFGFPYVMSPTVSLTSFSTLQYNNVTGIRCFGGTRLTPPTTIQYNYFIPANISEWTTSLIGENEMVAFIGPSSRSILNSSNQCKLFNATKQIGLLLGSADVFTGDIKQTYYSSGVGIFTGATSSQKVVVIQVKTDQYLFSSSVTRTDYTFGTVTNAWALIGINSSLITALNLNGLSGIQAELKGAGSSGATQQIGILNAFLSYEQLRYIRFGCRKNVLNQATVRVSITLLFDDYTFEVYNYDLTTLASSIPFDTPCLMEYDLHGFSKFSSYPRKKIVSAMCGLHQSSSGDNYYTIFTPIMLFSASNRLICPEEIQIGFEVNK